MKANKENIVNEILSELQKGAERIDILSIFVKKWQISDRTFDRHWKVANERHQQLQNSIKNKIESISTDAAIERLNKAILTKDERMEIASKIAKGEAWKVGSSVIAPTAGDRIRALDFMARIEGDYASVKQDITTKGESINAEKQDEERFQKLLKAAREGTGKNKGE